MGKSFSLKSSSNDPSPAPFKFIGSTEPFFVSILGFDGVLTRSFLPVELVKFKLYDKTIYQLVHLYDKHQFL